MTAERFAQSIRLRGYPARKAQIEKYISEHPKDSYEEEDLIDYYYCSQHHVLRRYAINGLCADGQDKYSPSNMK